MRWEYIEYHYQSATAKDIDPQVEALQYLCGRFELNMEQRYWLCFLYSLCYSVPTTYYIYNEFPDFIAVDYNRMQRWWDKCRPNLIFTTDRRWVRSLNVFAPICRAYSEFIETYGRGSQQAAIENSTKGRYDMLLTEMRLPQTNRFTMFLYSELLHWICGQDLTPSLSLVGAWSSKGALPYICPECFSVGSEEEYQKALERVKAEIDKLPIRGRYKTIWAIETCLCAYRKHVETGKRWVGYYIDRLGREIKKMENNTRGGGVNWQPLWDFRKETYERKYLAELNIRANNRH